MRDEDLTPPHGILRPDKVWAEGMDPTYADVDSLRYIIDSMFDAAKQRASQWVPSPMPVAWGRKPTNAHQRAPQDRLKRPYFYNKGDHRHG